MLILYSSTLPPTAILIENSDNQDSKHRVQPCEPNNDMLKNLCLGSCWYDGDLLLVDRLQGQWLHHQS